MGIEEKSEKPTLELLRQFHIFEGISDEELTAVKDNFIEKNYLPNVRIIDEEAQSNSLYLVISGTLDLLKWDSNNLTEISFGKLYHGDIFGEMSFLDRSERSATVKTISPTKLIEIPLDKISDNPDVLRKLIPNISLIEIKKLKKTSEALVNSIQMIKEQEKILKLSLFGFIYQYMMVTLVFIVFAIFFKNSPKEIPWVAAAFLSLCLIVKSNMEFLKFFSRLTIGQLFHPLIYLTASIALVKGFSFVFNNYIIFIPDVEWKIPLSLAPYEQWLSLAAYACSQEFIGRGVFQELLRIIFDDKAGYKSILLSAILLFLCTFSLGTLEAFSVFLISIPMGIIYHYYENLYIVFFVHTILLICNLVIS